MIQDKSNLYNQSHYFDRDGNVQDIEVNSSNVFYPQIVEFLKDNGHILQLYLANNPWRASSKETHSKIHQYCVFCSAKRFSNKSFHGTQEVFQALMDSKVRPGSGETLFTCKDLNCQGVRWFDAADHLPNDHFHSIFTPSHTHQLPETIAHDRKIHLRD